MSAARAAAPVSPRAGRVIGRYDRGLSGPVVVAVAGVHGNEPAGVAAIRDVLAQLAAQRPPLRGRLIGVVGNLQALDRRQRFVQRDLNRMWTADQVERARQRGKPADLDAESVEQRELLAVFDNLARFERTNLVFLDLHSTSALGPPFHCISDTLHSRRIALATPIPLVLGIEEAIRGSLLDFMEDGGWPHVLIEGGQHDAPDTAANLEAVLWHALVTVGALAVPDVPNLPAHVTRLRTSAHAVPRVVEVRYRHAVRPGDGFRMRPGFRNFQPVRRGQVLADDAHGPIAAPFDALLLMPLYQEQGDDGFFLVRPIHRGWLAVSRVMRTLRVDRLLPHLPGVARDPRRPTQLVVDPSVARWFTSQLFHLCGYRRRPERDGKLVFTRRIEGS